MGGLRKGLFSPFIIIPSRLLRAFQRKASPAVLKLAGFLGLSVALLAACEAPREPGVIAPVEGFRSEEHTSELQSLMRISYAVFCLQKKITKYKTVRSTTQ